MPLRSTSPDQKWKKAQENDTHKCRSIPTTASDDDHDDDDDDDHNQPKQKQLQQHRQRNSNCNDYAFTKIAQNYKLQMTWSPASWDVSVRVGRPIVGRMGPCNDNKYRQNVNNKPICDLLKLIGRLEFNLSGALCIPFRDLAGVGSN